MKRIRLQVALLPWAESGSQSSSGALRPWLQVCTAEMTLQDLADQIVQKFSSIYAGLGTLNIKHLESDWGEILDLTDTVGDVFDDRAPSGESRTSIVRVARYPPDTCGLRTTVRFGSLMPESSARPKKRPLAHSPLETQDNALYPLPTIENWSSRQPSAALEGANKRRKRLGSRRMGDADESSQEESRALSQTTRAQHPVQVNDSQHSSPRKHPNLYGTPISLPQDPLALHYNDHEVPDSSYRRRAMAIDLDRESTKSESPELRVSVHDTSPHDFRNQYITHHEITARKTIQSSPQAVDAQQQSLQGHNTNSSLQSIRSQIPAPSMSNLSQNKHRRPSQGSLALSESHLSCRSERSQRKEEEVLDPVESNIPKLGEKQHKHTAKRLRLSQTPEESSSRTSSESLQGRREGKVEKERLAKGKVETKAEGVRLAEERAEIDRKASRGRVTEDNRDRQDKEKAVGEIRAGRERAKEEGRRAAEEFLAKKRAESEKASTAPKSRSATPATWKYPSRPKIKGVKPREQGSKKEDGEERSTQEDGSQPEEGRNLKQLNSNKAASVAEKQSISRSPARQIKSDPRLESKESVDATSETRSSSVDRTASSTVKPTIASRNIVVSEDGVSTHDSSTSPHRLMSPPSTNSTDTDDAANAQLQSEYRASISPLRSRKATQANGVKPEHFRYPKLSEMMRVAKDTPTQSSLPQSSVRRPVEETFEDEDEDLSSDSDESSGSDEEGLGLSMVKGLRKLATMGRKNSAKTPAG